MLPRYFFYLNVKSSLLAPHILRYCFPSRWKLGTQDLFQAISLTRLEFWTLLRPKWWLCLSTSLRFSGWDCNHRVQVRLLWEELQVSLLWFCSSYKPHICVHLLYVFKTGKGSLHNNLYLKNTPIKEKIDLLDNSNFDCVIFFYFTIEAAPKLIGLQYFNEFSTVDCSLFIFGVDILIFSEYNIMPRARWDALILY